MKHLLSIIPALVCTTGMAQPLQHTWANRVGGPQDGEKLWRIAVDESGNVYAAGSFRGTFSDQGISVTSAGAADILLLKYDPEGQLLWARSAGGPYDDIAFGVESDKDGNVYIVGVYSGLAVFSDTIVSNIDPDGANLGFSFIARYSPDGELRWVRTPDIDFQPQNYPFNLAYGIKLDRFGDLVVAGSYNCSLPSQEDPAFSTMRFGDAAFRTCDYTSYDYVYAQKIDTLGNTEWVHSVGGSASLGVLQSIAFDPQGDIWFGGSIGGAEQFISGPVSLTYNLSGIQGLVYELSSAGQPLSGFLIDATAGSNVEDLIVANNGELFLSGWFRGSLNGAPSASGYDGFFMRTAPDGTPVWANRLVGIGDDFFSGIATTTQPNEVVGGAYYFFQAEFAGTTLDNAPGTNSALIRMDTTGVVLEVVQPEVLTGSSYIADVQSDIFGNFFLCGDVSGQVVFTNDTVTCGSQDMYVCKISPQASVSVDIPVQDRGDLRIWPNPASDRLFVENPGPGSALLEVRDAIGRLIIATTLRSGIGSVDTGLLPSGSYWATLVRSGARATRHLMIVR
jgi:hypothetical protein